MVGKTPTARAKLTNPIEYHFMDYNGPWSNTLSPQRFSPLEKFQKYPILKNKLKNIPCFKVFAEIYSNLHCHCRSIPRPFCIVDKFLGAFCKTKYAKKKRKSNHKRH
jgi:hypothetical protein